jgi:hypothetical protein
MSGKRVWVVGTDIGGTFTDVIWGQSGDRGAANRQGPLHAAHLLRRQTPSSPPEKKSSRTSPFPGHWVGSVRGMSRLPMLKWKCNWFR